jgi:hypothetical protein
MQIYPSTRALDSARKWAMLRAQPIAITGRLKKMIKSPLLAALPPVVLMMLASSAGIAGTLVTVEGTAGSVGALDPPLSFNVSDEHTAA